MRGGRQGGGGKGKGEDGALGLAPHKVSAWNGALPPFQHPSPPHSLSSLPYVQVVVVSKTFTTAETMLNARTLRDWLIAGVPGADPSAVVRSVSQSMTSSRAVAGLHPPPPHTHLLP